MNAKIALGLALLSLAANSLAGDVSGQFSVQITLNGASTRCTSSTASGSSVQVTCPATVFVNIAQVSAVSSMRFLPGFQPARDSLLPDYCRSEMARGDQVSRLACRLDDQRARTAAAETDNDGWTIERRLYAVNTDGEVQETLARLRLQDDRGTLTGIRLASANGRSGPVEMLVSF